MRNVLLFLASLLLASKKANATQLSDAIKAGHWALAQELVKTVSDDASRDAMLVEINKATEDVRVGARTVAAALRGREGTSIVSPALQWAQNASTIFLEAKYSAKWGAPSATSARLEAAGVEAKRLFLTASPPSGEQRFELDLELWGECEAALSSWGSSSVGRVSFTLRKKKRGVHWVRLTSGPPPWNAKYWFELQESLDYDSGWMKSVDEVVGEGERERGGNAKESSSSSSSSDVVGSEENTVNSKTDTTEDSEVRTVLDADLLPLGDNATDTSSAEATGRVDEKESSNGEGGEETLEATENANEEPKAQTAESAASRARDSSTTQEKGDEDDFNDATSTVPKKKKLANNVKSGVPKKSKSLKAKLAAVDKAAKKVRKGLDGDASEEVRKVDVGVRQEKARVEKECAARTSFAVAPPPWWLTAASVGEEPPLSPLSPSPSAAPAAAAPAPASSSSSSTRHRILLFAARRAAALAASRPALWRVVGMLAAAQGEGDAAASTSPRLKKKEPKKKKGPNDDDTNAPFTERLQEWWSSSRTQLMTCAACLALVGLYGSTYAALELFSVPWNSFAWLGPCLLLLPCVAVSVAALGVSCFVFRALN